MSNDNLPNWHLMAEKFDMWLPQIKPVGDAMLAQLQVRAGEKVVDIASGTGEPALTLAQAVPGADIIGSDSAAGMVAVAQAKVAKLGLKNIRFVEMPGENLDFDDNSFNKLLCRFGLMFFKDTQQGLRHMHRVLKPGGRCSLAVWHTPETMPTMHWSYQAFKGKIPEASLPAIEIITALGAPGLLARQMQEAGFKQVSVTVQKLHYTFDSFDHLWQMVEASGILKAQFDCLPAAMKDSVRDEVGRFAREFVNDSGLHVPHEYLLAYGEK